MKDRIWLSVKRYWNTFLRIFSLIRHKTILIISPEPWLHLHVSKHHYAIELARRGNTVFFLNPPSEKYWFSETKYDNLKVIDYKGFFKGLYVLPKILRIRSQRIVLHKIEKLSGVKFDVVWSFDNSVFFDLEVFGQRTLKISHIVDLNQDFQTARAARSANICIGVIPQIVQRLKQYNSNSHLIRHGVHVIPCRNEVELPGNNPVKALYFGNLKMPHLDWELMANAVASFSEVDFIFMGAHHEQASEMFIHNANAYFMASVESMLLSCYMKKADILLLFYTSTYYATYASPHKMMEYLSSGKPIVASNTKDYAEHSDIIMMANSHQEWLDHFQSLVEIGDRVGDEEKRRQLAMNNTYKKQVERIERIIVGDE